MANAGGKFGFRPEGRQASLINLDLARNDNSLLQMAEVVPFIMLLDYSTDAIIFSKDDRDRFLKEPSS